MTDRRAPAGEPAGGYSAMRHWWAARRWIWVACTVACGAAACSESDTTVTHLPPATFAVQSAGAASLSRAGEEDLSPRLLRRFKSLAVRLSPLSADLVRL